MVKQTPFYISRTFWSIIIGTGIQLATYFGVPIGNEVASALTGACVIAAVWFSRISKK